MAISMLKIRRSLGRLIFNMGIDIPGKTVFLIETAPKAYFTDIVQWMLDHQCHTDGLVQDCSNSIANALGLVVLH